MSRCGYCRSSMLFRTEDGDIQCYACTRVVVPAPPRPLLTDAERERLRNDPDRPNRGRPPKRRVQSADQR